MILKVRGCFVVIPTSLPLMTNDRDPQIKFGQRVRELRKRAGLSQEAFADLCELDRTYIGGIERGERNVSLMNIHRIASALHVRPLELFSYDE